MKLRHIEVFHALMNARNMTEAAEHLNVSQPAVSMVLRHAEQYLGLRLFDRTGGRFTPTPEAIALIPEVDEIYNKLNALGLKAQQLRDDAAGVLTITATPTLSNDFLPAAIAAYSALMPKPRLVTRQMITSKVLDEVLHRRAELGIVSQPGLHIDSALVDITVGKSIVHCVMSGSHRLAGHKVIHPKDLAQEKLIAVRPDTPLGAVIARAFAASDFTFSPTVEVTSSLAALPLAAAGVGIALIESGRAVERFAGIVAKPFVPEIETRAVVVHHKERPLSRLAAVFVDCLKRTSSGNKESL